MLRVDRVLFPTDFSPLADVALEHAVELAVKHGATLHMLHAVVLHADDPNDPAHLFPDVEEIARRLEEAAEERMTSLIDERRLATIPLVRAQRRGISVAPVILDHSLEIDADLVVMSTHGRRGLGHALLGSVAEEVVRQSFCPVLTVRARAERAPLPGARDVLVPIDFSEHAARALSYGKEICGAYGARLHVLHVFERPIYPEIYFGGTLDIPDLGTLEGSLRSELARLVEDAPGPRVDTEIHIREGRATAGILDAAEELDPELIVIATHGLTGLAHVLLGSVAEKVVRRAPCPVLSVRAFGKSLLA